VRDGLFTTTTAGLFGLNGVAAFIAALFAGLTVGTLAAGALNHDESHRPVIERHFGKKRIRILELMK